MQNTNGHIVLVTQFHPDPKGHGGNHRAYQIHHDLLGCVKPESITCINFDSQDGSRQAWHNRKAPNPATNRLNILLKERLPYLRAAHPIEKLMNKWFMFDHFSQPEFSRHYAARVENLPRPLICIMENAGFGPGVLPFNKKNNIPTLICPQNIESWDRLLPINADDPRQKYLACMDFADEWRIMEQCELPLFISKVEHALFASLGLRSLYYPYRPVGEIEHFWKHIREARTHSTPDDHRFLMVGSCSHSVTRHAFEQILGGLAGAPPPPGMHLIIAGHKSELLKVPHALKNQVEIRGRIPEQELSEELVRIRSLIVPHEVGFGALTRLSEFSCGGVPVMASAFARLSMTPPPGIQWIHSEHEGAWSEAIAGAMQRAPAPATWEEYVAWHSQQESPLPGVIQNLLFAC